MVITDAGYNGWMNYAVEIKDNYINPGLPRICM